MFWTGNFTECTLHADIGTLSVISAGGTESTITLTTAVNLRASKLNISLENPNNSQMEIWLLSENDTWGADDFASQSARFTGTTASFDVVETFVEGAQGFDPENVKQVVIKNLGDNAVSNVSVTSSCKNAVGISNCQVAYNEQNSRWEVSADVSNKGNVSSYAVTGQVNSSDVVTSTSEPSLWTSDRATWNIDHNPYESYQGSTFNFTASAINASGETFSTACTPAVTIGSISCSNATSSNIASGAAWPAFNFKLNNCPQNSCNYEIWFDGSLLSGNSACTDGSCSGSGGGNQALSKTKSGNAEECTTDGGCSHTYEVHSSDDDKPFTPCNVSFVVQKKVSTEVTATCSFESATIYLGQNAKFKANSFSVSDKNISLELLGPNGESIDTQASFWANNNYEKDGIKPTSTGTFTYILNAEGGEACRATLTVNAPTATCSISPTTMEQGEKVTVSVSSITPQNTNVSLVVKEGTTTKYEQASYWSNNSYNQEFEMTSTGTFVYSVILSGIELCSETVTVSGVTPTAQTCKFSNTSRVYGEKVKFQVEKLKVPMGATWELDDANGTKVAEGTYSGAYSQTFWETGEFYAKTSGTYTLKLNGSNACTANLSVTQPTAENCKLDANPISSGGSTTFRWDLKNCKDNQCSYEIKLDGSYFYGESNVGEQNDRQRTVSTAGEYVVWLNGVATNCKKTLTVAASGSLTCSIAENLAVDDQWQKIKVSSTRLKGQYDVWIDGSIGDDSNGNLMTGIWIEKDATNVDIGGFTCSTSGPHTYKITATGSSTSLCNGSFNCLNVPKVDCYFLYNSNWSDVSGSVLPETQLQFCASQASFNKQTTLTGTKKSGTFSKTDFYLSKDGRQCYYFEAPSSDGSYTFSVSANGEEACNNTPVLEVEMPANAITLTYGGSLTTINAGTWSVFSDNPNSGVLRCKATANVDITVDETPKTVTTSLNSIDGANPRPTVAVTVTVPTGKSIQCHTDW